MVVLYYVSNWMLSKSETEAWNAYIQGQVDSSVETGSSFALAFTAWLSVFREGAEVILFYQPLLAEEHMPMVWAGMGVATLVLVAVYIAVRYFSVRLPLKPFFRITSVFMFCMSISFLGNGIPQLILVAITIAVYAWQVRKAARLVEQSKAKAQTEGTATE